MSSEWFYLRRWRQERLKRKIEEENKKSLNKDASSTVEDEQPKQQDSKDG